MIKDKDDLQAEAVLNYLVEKLGAKEVAERVTNAMQEIVMEEADGFDSINGWYSGMEEDSDLSDEEIGALFDEHCTDIFGDSRIDYSGVNDEFWDLLHECELEYDSSFLTYALIHFREDYNE